MLRAGIVGLGRMGGGAAVCLARAGRPLTVYDVNPHAALAWEGGELVPPVERSCAEVARKSDVVVVAVVDERQVWSVLQGADGLFAGAHPDLVIVIVSTISLNGLARIRTAGEQAGVTIVDAGVTSTPGGKTQGRIACMVGADPAIFARIKEVLDDFTQRAVLMGGPGTGMATKIVRNMMYYATWRAAYEARLLAEKAGIDIAQLAEINQLGEADISGTTLWLKSWADFGVVPGAGMITRAHIERIIVKDIAAAHELAEHFNLALPILAIMNDGLDEMLSPWH